MAGTGFDDPGVYYSSLWPDDSSEAGGGGESLNRTAAVKRFKEFLKTFLDHDNCFCYRYSYCGYIIGWDCLAPDFIQISVLKGFHSAHMEASRKK